MKEKRTQTICHPPFSGGPKQRRPHRSDGIRIPKPHRIRVALSVHNEVLTARPFNKSDAAFPDLDGRNRLPSTPGHGPYVRIRSWKKLTGDKNARRSQNRADDRSGPVVLRIRHAILSCCKSCSLLPQDHESVSIHERAFSKFAA